jgi:hypothetical protein
MLKLQREITPQQLHSQSEIICNFKRFRKSSADDYERHRSSNKAKTQPDYRQRLVSVSAKEAIEVMQQFKPNCLLRRQNGLTEEMEG